MSKIITLTANNADTILNNPNASRVAILTPLNQEGVPHLCTRWGRPFVGRFDEIVHIPVQAKPPIGEKYAPYIDEIMSNVDGMLLPGGHSNIHPSFYKPFVTEENDLYDEARDHFALHMIQIAEKYGIPGLFVCRGMQELGIRHGMTLEKLENNGINHGAGYIHDGNHERMDDLIHTITIQEGGVLAKIFGKITRKVNSIHNYGFDKFRSNPPAEVKIEAIAPDNIIEAISTLNGQFLGFQPHPEFNFEGRNFWHNGIFGERIAKFKEKHSERTGIKTTKILELAL
ncbi:MAG: gamma-glutamyl-gamma-aminobutyrate hydrolase family protein [Micavibrio sp.]|nr:gamma-glutamyl-gamma-aminobutyrate hydrolase family protein [Micavibrio sp.]